MKLIIIEGPTSTGKSALGRRLAKDLKIKSFLKDEYKEQKYDSLKGVPTLKLAKKIEHDSWEKMFNTIEAAQKNRKSLLIEGNFHRYHSRRLKKIIRQDVVVVEIFCYAKGLKILKRYIHRNRSGERHKGHRDHLLYPIIAFEGLVLGFKHYQPLGVSSNLIKVDTNDFAKVNYETISKFISESK